MPAALWSFNVFGIVFISRDTAEARAITYDAHQNKTEHRVEVPLKPPCPGISRWSDDRLIVTFVSSVQPGNFLDFVITYTGGFYDHKKDPWPAVWQDSRIGDLIYDTIAVLVEKAGFAFDDAKALDAYGPGGR